MLKIFSCILIGLISNIFCCYLFTKTINEKFKLDRKILIISLILSLINCYSIYCIPEIRPFITNISVCIMYIIIYKKTLSLTIILELSIFFMFVISEILFIIIFVGIFKVNQEFLKNTVIGYMIINIFTFIICYILFNSIFKKIFKIDINNWKINNKKSIPLYVLSIITMTLLMVPVFNHTLSIREIIFFSIITIFSIVFVYGYFSTKNKNINLIKKYDTLSLFLKNYEKIIDEKSKQQHENSNQLVIIKSLINENNKKAHKYIDEILNSRINKNDDDILKKLKCIPEGIKGLIYYKIEEMKENNIIVYIETPSNINNKDKKTIEQNLKNISLILGVILDNAKEASNKADKKYIIIEISYEKDIIFTISNTYKSNTNLDNVGKNKFTLKGNGHGYGLSIVNDIVKNNDNFEFEKRIEGMYYVQVLKIKK